MAIDYGRRATGIALSDELRITVRPLTTLRTDRGETRSLVDRIVALALEYEVGTILVGLPLRLDGTRGDAANLVERFARRLNIQLTIPVILRDERLTSRAADELLREQGARASRRRSDSDQVAAAILLEDYLAEDGRIRAAAKRDSHGLGNPEGNPEAKLES